MRNRRMPIVVALAAILASSTSRSAQAGDKDIKLLQGKWRVVSAKSNGSDFPKEMVAKMFVTVEADRIRVYVEGSKSEQTATFTADGEKSPGRIDFTRQVVDRDWERGLLFQKLFTSWKQGKMGPEPAGHVAEGIYKLEGDTLTLCWRTTKAKELLQGGASKEESVRPSLFQSVLYYHQFLFVLKRVESEK